MIIDIIIIVCILIVLGFAHEALHIWTKYRIGKIVDKQLKQWNEAWSILRKRRGRK